MQKDSQGKNQLNRCLVGAGCTVVLTLAGLGLWTWFGNASKTLSVPASVTAQTVEPTVYVLLFNAHSNNEGIHTIFDRGRNRVFMFESKDDAIGLARRLEAQDFPIPTVEAINLAVVKEFCRKSDYDCELIPTGTTVIPPTDNGEWSRRSGITWKTQSSPN